jgi:hypothetical protein
LTVTLVTLAALAAAACKEDKEDLPANLVPAAGETVRYSKVGTRCPVYLEKFKGADGDPAGATCVSHQLLAQICRRATRCEEAPLARKEPLLDRRELMRPARGEQDR